MWLLIVLDIRYSPGVEGAGKVTYVIVLHAWGSARFLIDARYLRRQLVLHRQLWAASRSCEVPSSEDSVQERICCPSRRSFCLREGHAVAHRPCPERTTEVCITRFLNLRVKLISATDHGECYDYEQFLFMLREKPKFFTVRMTDLW